MMFCWTIIQCMTLFVGVCLSEFSAEFPSTTDSSLVICPGKCVLEGLCVNVVNNTDCPDASVCCLDSTEGATDASDWLETTQYSDEYITSETYNNPSITVDEDMEEATEYMYIPADEHLNALSEDRQGDFEYESCPGACVPEEHIGSCSYIVDSDSVCPAGEACCIADEEVQEPELEADSSEVQSFEETEAEKCPGVCIHPSHYMFCETVTGYKCPLNALCCVKRAGSRALPLSSVTECTGQCLPLSLPGYCLPPNQLISSPTTCVKGTICCMQTSGEILPPTVHRMHFPGNPIKPANVNPTHVVLGHLAIDESGTIYQVKPQGQISPLTRLRPLDHQKAKFNRIIAYPRPDGEIVIFADTQNKLYQQFFPRQQTFVHQPVDNLNVQGSEAHATGDVKITEALEDVVIPDEDDEPPQPTAQPVTPRNKTPNPPCPGSCMSYFLRFTCFRGYAIYDGFSCPGRSVCCAPLKDIEEHENYLKSLSPYFNTPPSSRDSNVPRCGMKGRRDTPRALGGKDSLPGEWCWQVAIINVQNQYICAGALIDNSWILTAAHCVAEPARENQALFIRAGVTDLRSSEDNNQGQTVRVMSTFVHHNFKSLNLDNNIALLRLQKPLELKPNVCVVCLPTSGKMPVDSDKCTGTGYGFVSADGEMSLKTREEQIPIIDDTDCMTNVTEALQKPFILPASSFCAGGLGLTDACQGDSGGPLTCEVGGYHELVGLVSWSLGCGRSDVPSIYIKVPAFMGWINQIISSSSFLMSSDH